MSKIEPYITSIPDFPEPGVIFRDITTAIGSADGLQLSVDEMAALLEGEPFDVVAGLESRGFLFGMPIAYKLHKPFIPIRKEGKLPRETVGATYSLEYGTATIEVHKDDIKPGMRVVLIDDLIATGGRQDRLPAGAEGPAWARPSERLSAGDRRILRRQIRKGNQRKKRG